MEGLALGLHGIDLEPGDEVVTTRIDYDSCIEILRQREKRDRIVLKLIDIPLPARTPEEVVAAFEAALTPRTRMILCCHMINKNGQVLPVREICAMARRRGVVTVIDGAQSIGHISFALRDLGCDVYATSLHKWYFAPRGTGFLYVRRDMIEKVWPIWASWSGKPPTSIEKFEDYGTGMKAVAATLTDVVAFNDAIGAEAKEARLRYLRNLWLEPLANVPRVRLLTDPDPRWSCAIGAFIIEGKDPDDIVKRLRAEHSILVGSIKHADAPNVRGISVAADLTNSPQDIERFAEITARLAMS
jgi:selenocysteine lyase/cysteine desulfurase